MTSINAQITNLQAQINTLNARLLGVTPNNMVYAAMGAFVRYGCKVTESATPAMSCLLQGQASGDSANLNPDLSATPTRIYQYPNIAGTKAGSFFSQDTSATINTAPAAGLGRFDIAYIFAGKEGAGFAVAEGTASAAAKAEYDANGVSTSDYATDSPHFDPTLPDGAVPVARIYVGPSVTTITDSVIADIRPEVDIAGTINTSDTDASTWSFVLDEDDMASDSDQKLATQQSIKAYVASQVAGLFDYKGEYNASTNSPDLDTSPSGILKGDVYVVSVAGTFFTIAVEVGDTLLAEQDSPTLESHWTIIQANIDGAITALVDDTTPQLGGNLDGQGFDLSRVKLKDYSDKTVDLGTLTGGTGGSAESIDLEDGGSFIATISTATQEFTFDNPDTTPALHGFTLTLTNGGSQTLIFPTNTIWQGGTAPALSASGTDTLCFYTLDGSNGATATWYAFLAGKDMS